MTNTSQTIKKTVADLLKNASARNKDIISRRFGLKTGKRETLESIGASYNITRERVRQIEETTVNQLCQAVADNDEVNRYIALAKDILAENGGIIKEEDLFRSFSGQEGSTVINSSLVFLLSLSDELIRRQESDDFNSFWAVNKDALDSFKNTTAGLISVLKKSGRVITRDDFSYVARKTNVPGFSGNGKPLSDAEIELAMAVSKDIGTNIFNEVGLASWSEIKPKGVRDKAFLVLKKSGEPRHFSEIAKLINGAGFNNRKANIQTVHNELIKDERFILVGRGMYALSEWGYKAGVVSEVITEILKQAGKPLPKEKIIDEVLTANS